MRNYWTCSKFADWLRGTAKGGAKTAEDWEEWRITAKMRHNFRYWLAEEGLDYVQSFIMYIPDKIYAAKYYVNNRWISRSHSLTAHARDIKPGTWCDVGHRFLPCLFNELVDFVEVELAWWHLVWAEKEEREKFNAPWWRFGWWNLRLWRCPQAGLENLEWQRNLRWKEEDCEEGSPNIGQLTPQAVAAQEILDLYQWWTVTYRNRPDPHEASGWSDYCNAKREENGNDSILSFLKETNNPTLRAAGDVALKKLHEIEAAYEQEDEDMMIRLIKIRQGLWT
jgi:hypothetical protein